MFLRALLISAFVLAGAARSGELVYATLENTLLGEDTAERGETITPALAAVQHPPLRVRVTSHNHVVLSSQIGGKVEKIQIRDGDEFSAGDVLLVLDDSLHKIQRERAAAMLNRHDLLYRMYRDLADRQSKGEMEVEVAAADREHAAAELKLADAMLVRTRVEAPFRGRVTEIFIRENQFVTDGQPLLQVVDEQGLALEFIMNSSWMRHFPVGHRFPVKIFETGETYTAVIERYGGRVDPVSQSVKVYARLDGQPAGLMEGMSGEALLPPPDEAGR